MEKSENELEALRSEAIAYCNQGEFDKAITIHKDILTRYKDNDQACAYAYASIGDIYLTLRKLGMAKDNLKQALSYEPLNPQFHYLLGFTYSVSNKWDKAIREFELSVKQVPDNPEYLRGLGWAMWHAGKKARGLKYLGRAVSLAPDNANILADLAVACLGDGDFDRAGEYAERAVRANPESDLAKDVLNTTIRFQEASQAVHHSARESRFSIYEMKVKLKGTRPAIWRRFQISGNVTLYKLHRALQEIMGWSDYHLYKFRIGQSVFGEQDPDYAPETISARRVRLSEILPVEMAKFIYIYDFGDYWEHEILVERILPSEHKLRYPVCIKGKRACPPEDCGGVWRYAELLEIIRNPAHEEYREMMEWLGDEFYPAQFDLSSVNRRLKYIG